MVAGIQRCHPLAGHHDDDQTLSVSRQPDTDTMGQTEHDTRLKATRGEPDAMKVARPVRKSGKGKRPGGIRTPRPLPTLTGVSVLDPAGPLISSISDSSVSDVITYSTTAA